MTHRSGNATWRIIGISLICGIQIFQAAIAIEPTKAIAPVNLSQVAPESAKQAPSIAQKASTAPVDGSSGTCGSCQQGRDPKESSSNEYWTTVFTGASALISLLALLVAIVQACFFRDQLAIMRDQIAVTLRPKINITNLVIYKTDAHDSIPPDFTPGEKISGYAFAVNVGPATTEIDKKERNFCKAYWLDELPMFRPYNSEKVDPTLALKRHKEINQPEGEVIHSLRSGEFGSWRFTTTVQEGKTLYVMGTIFHRDSLNVRHATLFCRRYNVYEKRFEAVENPDYECTE